MPSLIPGFEYDIFISYRHKDNKGDHWVTKFVSALKTELEATFKEDISIYFDQNPHDGLLETHNVDKSLEGKLKCLIFIPIISQTYCDPRSFAWQHEFCAFNKLAKEDQFGVDTKSGNRNVACRILPIKIHDLDAQDKTMVEKELGGVLRVIEFIYREPGVNRPLRPNDADATKNQNQVLYRNQVNKVANAIKEIITSLENPGSQLAQTRSHDGPAHQKAQNDQRNKRIWLGIFIVVVLAGLATSLLYSKLFRSPKSVGDAEKSIAVLPFVNMSNDPGQEYFSDGLTDEMIYMLAKVPTLKVIGRTSSFQFKGKNTDLREIGKQLGVANILEGSVRKSEDKVKITITLINTADGTSIWSSDYERKSEDVLKIHDDIVAAIVSQLKIDLLERLAKSPSVNKQAFDLYLKGRGAWNIRQLKQSENYFRLALEADSLYPAAYAGLAETYMLFPFFGAGAPLEYFPKAQVASEKAIQLDNTLSVPYLVLAMKNDNYDLNSDLARKYFLEALRKNPYYAPNHYLYVHHLVNNGSTLEEALQEIDNAIELEPLFPVPYAIKGRVFMFHKKFKEALGPLQHSLDLDKARPLVITCFFLGHCYMQLDQLKEAEKYYKMASTANDHRATAALINLYMQTGKITQAKVLFDDLTNISKSGFLSKITLANAASFTRNTELAHQLLKEAIDERDPWLLNATLEYPTRQPNDLLSDPRNVMLLKSHSPTVLSLYNIHE